MLRGLRHCLVLVAACLSGCVPREPPEPPPPPPLPTPQILYEEDVRPIESPQLMILNVDETRTPGTDIVTVTGTIVNRGTGATRTLIVTVHALDANGNHLLSVLATPSALRIGPGTTAAFAATFARPAETDQYHVEAVAH